MRVLGLSFDFHDSSAALVKDGKLVYACAEERLTRQKHDSHFPFFAIRSALESQNLSTKEIDRVVFYENQEQKFSRLLSMSLSSWPLAPKEFSSIMTSWLGSKLWTKARIAQKLQVPPEKIHSIPHHLSHAYQAFVGSGFSEAAVMVMDAVGEWDSGSTYRAFWKEGRPQFQLISESKFPNSLGLFYSAMTDFLGFKPMNDECTTMALAAFGQPLYYETLCKILQLKDDGSFILSREFFNFTRFYRKPYTQKLIRLLGVPRSSNEPLYFSSFSSTPSSPDHLRFANIAASVQKITEDILVRQAQSLTQKTGLTNLCLAGGVALNCVANTRIWQESGCKNFFIPPEPGDGGASIGAAFAGHFQTQIGDAESTQYGIAMGPKFEEIDFTKVLQELNPHFLHKFRQLKSSKAETVSWTWKTCMDRHELTSEVAQLISNGNIVGWFQDSMELGPRALGQRSILIRPDNVELAQKLSNKVKLRAPFRPYALSMNLKTARDILSADRASLFEQTPLQWMQLAISVRPEFRELVRAGLHIDGSTRPQVVKDINNIYFHLLEKTETLTGLGCLLNTSFNEKDYPIVASPIEALMMFARTDMDVLVINKLIIKKTPLPQGESNV